MRPKPSPTTLPHTPLARSPGELVSWWTLAARCQLRREVLLGFYEVPAGYDAPLRAVINPGGGAAARAEPRAWDGAGGRLKFVVVRPCAPERRRRRARAQVQRRGTLLGGEEEQSADGGGRRRPGMQGCGEEPPPQQQLEQRGAADCPAAAAAAAEAAVGQGDWEDELARTHQAGWVASASSSSAGGSCGPSVGGTAGVSVASGGSAGGDCDGGAHGDSGGGSGDSFG